MEEVDKRRRYSHRSDVLAFDAAVAISSRLSSPRIDVDTPFFGRRVTPITSFGEERSQYVEDGLVLFVVVFARIGHERNVGHIRRRPCGGPTRRMVNL